MVETNGFILIRLPMLGGRLASIIQIVRESDYSYLIPVLAIQLYLLTLIMALTRNRQPEQMAI